MTQAQAAQQLLTSRQDAGVTWRELARVENMGHGSASRVLSDLHRAGIISRLDEKRDGCTVYVATPWLRGRDPVPYHQRPTPDREDAAAMAGAVQGVIERWGLDGSRFPSMRALAADLRRAVNRPQPDDVLTLPTGEPTRPPSGDC